VFGGELSNPGRDTQVPKLGLADFLHKPECQLDYIVLALSLILVELSSTAPSRFLCSTKLWLCHEEIPYVHRYASLE
jgi:hypothetical protein